MLVKEQYYTANQEKTARYAKALGHTAHKTSWAEARGMFDLFFNR